MSQMRENPPRVAIYTRVSSDEQVREHFSLETQRDRCIAKLDEVLGKDLYVARFFSDDGIPGRYGLYDPANPRRKHRPGLTAMRDGFKAGELDMICVYRSDRLWRRAALGDLLRFEFIPYGLQRIISCNDNMDLTTASGRFQIDVNSAVGAYYVEQLAENVKDGLRKRKEHGYCMGRPYAWRPQTELEQTGRKPGLVPIPEQAEVVREMAERYASGESIRQITKWLNTLAVPTPRSGCIWHTTTVRHIIANPVNAGLMEIEGDDGATDFVPAEHFERRIYDPEVFHRIRDRLARNRKRGGAATRNPQYLLAGIVRCGHCGRRLIGKLASGRTVRAYRCALGSRESDPQCTRNTEDAVLVENLVIEELQRLASDASVRMQARERVRVALAAQEDADSREYKGLQARLEKLWNTYRFWSNERTEGRCLEDEFETHLQEFRENKAQVEARLQELEAQQALKAQRESILAHAQELVNDFGASWDGLSVAQRRELIHGVIEDATVGRLPDGSTQIVFTVRGFAPVTRRIGRRARADRPSTGPGSLTRREQAFMYHHSQGKTPETIARDLGIGARQVRYQLANARKKLGAKTLDEAWEVAREFIAGNLHWLPLKGRSRKHRPPKQGPLLTEAQIALLSLLAQGMTVADAARALDMKGSTPYVHLKNSRDRLGCASNEEAVRKAKDLGLVR